MKKNAKRQGFTLVELLIVIVVIGVLSAMMMLSSTEAVSSARASDIVSDLRNLKTAALAWYADNLDYIENG
ncbi:MAG: prepilin-type N-terminal cleavage/methylation domain-containing protein [Synergistaceae bacterium]|nr:prepilin-type N-terminal cleavage/methylation domain-containing protein [Synergistaceae bacterium]